MSKTTKISFVILSIFGIIISFYLYISKITSNYFCPIGNCSIVNHSKYAEIGSIPVAFLGIIFYTLLILFTEFLKDKYGILKLWLISGFLFSLYLTAIEVFVIHHICIWCMISFILTIILNTLYIFDLKAKKIASDHSRLS
jgi:uncharacterized membrane protein